MKRIFTVTTQFANNQGALLQCYALSKYLNSFDGIECKVIDYYPTIASQSWKLLPKPKSLRGLAKNIYTCFNFPWILGKLKKNRSMRQFISEWLPTTELKYDRNSILSTPPMGDYYVCGSDQIWNFTVLDDMTYYLDFAVNIPNAKLISYAASISDKWSKEQEEVVKPIISNFKKITLREEGNIEQVSNLLPNKEIFWVCDPVFLLDIRIWDEMAIVPNISEDYILCYFLNIDTDAVKIVNKLRKLTGLKVINLALSSREKFESDIIVYDYTPREFVGYIKNAKYICTNSFHCSAFASIYRKNFRFIPKSWANERLLSLEKLYGYKVIQDKSKIDEFNVAEMIVDYSGASKMDEFIKSSKQILLESIDEQ